MFHACCSSSEGEKYIRANGGGSLESTRPKSMSRWGLDSCVEEEKLGWVLATFLFPGPHFALFLGGLLCIRQDKARPPCAGIFPK